MRRVIHSMGIPISIDIPACNTEQIFASCEARLHAIDARFSTYKKDSEVSRFNKGKLEMPSAEFKEVMAACVAFEDQTDGYFSAYYQAPTYDPTGYVKGWAIREIGSIIQKAGYRTYLINAAGDIEAASDGAQRWHIGVQHPFEPSQTIATITLKNGAVATSGTYERGAHIYNPHSQQAAKDTVSATVWGKDIITADVYATTLIAMEPKAARQFIEQHDYQALIVAHDGMVHSLH